MYNNIGLGTSRGSATNGYIQSNIAKVRYKSNDKNRLHKQSRQLPKLKKVNKDLLEHEKKRKIENELLEIEMDMQEKGFAQEEIDVRVADLRRQKMDALSRDTQHATDRVSHLKHAVRKDRHAAHRHKDSFKDSHELEDARDRKNSLFAKAVRINKSSFVSGDAFDFEGQKEKKRLQRLQEQEEAERQARRERKRIKKEKQETYRNEPKEGHDNRASQSPVHIKEEEDSPFQGTYKDEGASPSVVHVKEEEISSADDNQEPISRRHDTPPSDRESPARDIERAESPSRTLDDTHPSNKSHRPRYKSRSDRHPPRHGPRGQSIDERDQHPYRRRRRRSSPSGDRYGEHENRRPAKRRRRYPLNQDDD